MLTARDRHRKRVHHRKYMREYLKDPIHHARHLQRVAKRYQTLAIKSIIARLGEKAFAPRTCQGECGKTKPTYAFRTVRGSKRYQSRTCRECDNKENKKYTHTEKRRTWSNDRHRRHRRDPERRASCILRNSKSTDNKTGLKNDLDIDFISAILIGGCSYCGVQSLKLSLDRKDNTIGHLKSNVTPACLRCNLLRRDMPYEAWLFIVPSIRRAEQRGLFASWTGRWDY